jgi:rubrerythrin
MSESIELVAPENSSEEEQSRNIDFTPRVGGVIIRCPNCSYNKDITLLDKRCPSCGYPLKS